MDLIDSFGLCQSVAEPTHQLGHLLDLIITKSTTRNLLTDVRVQFDLPADHAVVTTRLSVPRPVPTKILVNHRKLKAIDPDAFKSSVCSSTITPSAIDACDIVNELTDTYNSVLCNLMDFHAPCRSRYITLRPHAPWFDDSLRAAKQDKRRLERKLRKTRLEIDRQRYRHICDDYHKLLDKAKSTYHIDKLANCDQLGKLTK